MKTISKILIAILLFGAGLYVGATQPWLAAPLVKTPIIQSRPTATSTVSFMLDFGSGLKNGKSVVTYPDVPVSQDEIVLSVLDRLSKDNTFALETKDYGGLGVLVTGIKGVKNTQAGDTYWQYWVNNRYSTVGAQAYKLTPGDVVMWKYVKGDIE